MRGALPACSLVVCGRCTCYCNYHSLAMTGSSWQACCLGGLGAWLLVLLVYTLITWSLPNRVDEDRVDTEAYVSPYMLVNWLNPAIFDVSHPRGNVRRLGDVVSVKCALGFFSEAMIVGLAKDHVEVLVSDHTESMSVRWSEIR